MFLFREKKFKIKKRDDEHKKITLQQNLLDFFQFREKFDYHNSLIYSFTLDFHHSELLALRHNIKQILKNVYKEKLPLSMPDGHAEVGGDWKYLLKGPLKTQYKTESKIINTEFCKAQIADDRPEDWRDPYDNQYVELRKKIWKAFTEENPQLIKSHKKMCIYLIRNCLEAAEEKEKTKKKSDRSATLDKEIESIHIILNSFAGKKADSIPEARAGLGEALSP